MDCAKLYQEADFAGTKAGTDASPTPMVVGSPTTPLGNDIDRQSPHTSSMMAYVALLG